MGGLWKIMKLCSLHLALDQTIANTSHHDNIQGGEYQFHA